MHRHPTKGITFAHKAWHIHAKQLYYIWRITLNRFVAHIQNLYAFRPFVRLHSLNQANYQTILMLSLFSCILFTTFSQAKPVHLASGGTVELHSDGTITGTCYQQFDLQRYKRGRAINPDDNLANFIVTMPDGAVIRTQCINPDRFVSADGTYSFTAVPDSTGKAYEITVHSEVSARYAGYGTDVDWSYGHSSIGQNTSTAGCHPKWAPRMTGWIAIQKASSNPDCSNNNSMYSLEGAVYDIYDSQGSIVDTITTDKKGYGCSHELILGSYKVWERTTPKGYALDTQGHAVDVSAGETQKLTLTDIPQNDPVRMVVQKIDADTQTPTSEGAATLAGAEFTLKFYPRESATGMPARTWVLKTDKDGVASLLQASTTYGQYFVKGQNFYLDSQGRPTLPLGTLTIEETKAPSGYLLNSHDVHTVHITSDNTNEEEVHSYVVPKHKDQVNRGGIRIEKIDRELMSNSAQGDATLEGITFAVVNLNTQAVKTSMGMCEPHQVCARITTTNKDGHFIAQTSDQDLPFGHYKIYEESSNDSYLNDGFKAEFDITHDQGLVSLTDANSCAQDSVVRGGIKLGKIDRELNVHTPQGGATLEGAQFSVYNSSKTAVMVEGKLIQPGDLATTITTDRDGYASLSDHCLPYGTYTICETQAPKGYKLNSTWERTVKIRKNGTVYDLSSIKESVDDSVQRGSVEIIKLDKELVQSRAQGDATLEGITFAVVNLNDSAVKTSMGVCKPNQVCASITTSYKDGHFIAQTSNQELPYGHYKIYEKSSNDSYLNDGFSAEFDITNDQELVSLTDANSCAQDSVVRGGIKLGKIDRELNVHTPQGAATLEGTEFSVYNKSTAAVMVEGKLIQPGDLATTITTNKDGYASLGDHALPYGTYLVQETKAPKGYELNSMWQRVVKIRKNGTVYDLSSIKESVDDLVQRGGIHIEKIDRELMSNKTQGDATLEGITFAVVNLNTQAVKTSMGMCEPNKVCARITTANKDGHFIAQTSDKDLPYGHYRIYEESSNNSYLNDGFEAEFDIDRNKQIVDLTQISNCAQDSVVRGGIKLGKIDKELNKHNAQGAATLEGAEFSVYNKSASVVKIGDKLVAPNELVTVLKTDKTGCVVTDRRMLPFGTYLVQETKAPIGYELNIAWERYVKILKDSTIYDLSSEKESVDDQVQRGSIRIEKMDKDLMSNSAQGDATLEGITFAITNLNNKAVKTSMGMCEPNKVCARITTSNKDDHFIAQTLDKDLPYGHYKIYEESSNDSYLNDGFKAEFDITKDKELVSLTDTKSCAQDSVVRGGIKLGKIDKDLNKHNAQGGATLEGAEFSVYNKSTAAVMVNGKLIKPGDLATTVTANKDGYASLSDHCLPYGTYLVQETKAPRGYELNSTWNRTVKIRKDGTIYDLSSEKESVDDQVQRGSVRIEKMDKELMSNKAQGDATLEGITFAVVNLNDKAVKTSMGMCEPQHVCARITTTNKDGHFIAQTSDKDLPYGHYRIYEESSNDSYVNDNFEATFNITKDKELVSLTDAKTCAKDSVVRGGIKLGKIDKELNVHTPQGGATLEGAEFSVYNKSTAAVMVEGKLIQPGDLATTITTDKTGCVVTDKHMLPYGTYTICETKAPEGYELNSEWSREVKVRKDGTIYDLSSEKESVDDQVNRGDIRLIKRDDETQKPMSGVIFKLTSKTTGETHLLMTDENGEINTSSEFVKHSYKTNQNDSALNADGTCDTTKLVTDVGVWFGGTKDTKDGAKPSDTLGALPYDTYTIQELRSPQNKGKKLISFDIHLTRPRYNLILGTLNNKPAESFITELLSTNSNHSAYAEEKTTLTDTLSFENLNVGATYTVSGYLVEKDTGEPLQDAQGKDIRVEKTFTARIASDRVKLVYTFNAKGLNGKSVVAFATLKDKDGNIICSEKDLDEEDQSVRFTNPPKPPEPPVCPPTPPVTPPEPPVCPPTPPVCPPTPPVCPPCLPPTIETPKPPAPPVTPTDVPPTPPVTPPDKPADEPPDVPSDTSHESLAKTSDITRVGLGLLALGTGIGLISYGIYRKRKNTHKH